MKNFLFFTHFIVLFYSCNTEKIKQNETNIHLNDGLVVNISFNNSFLETISNTDGLNTKSVFVKDRKNLANKAIHFNRNDSSMVSFGDLEIASFTNAIFSISFWILLEDTLKPCAILSKRSAYGGFEYSIDNHFRNKQNFNFDNWNVDGTKTVYGIDPLNASAPIVLNTWQHIVFVANGSQLKVFCNGVLQDNFDVKNNEIFANTDKHFVIGNGGGYGKNYYFQGAIDDVKMYNRVLNNEEINALFIE
jgi:hypothetical protein